MGDSFTLNSAHNFGIYTKSGKRTIFQIDFSCKRISLIEKGKFSKTYDFLHLEQYDSEENLHIVIRFRNNKTLEFDADTAEEKYTICRLLGIILGAEQVDTNSVETRQNGAEIISTKKQIIKEGILDKKGNTKIPTWSRRRLQVCPGEFSYYKPGDEVALNLVQLWENSTSVSRNGQNGFVVAVRDRSYYFRLTSEKGINVELERDKWIQAFQQASQRKRATFLLLEMAKNTEYVNQRQGMALPTTPIDENEDVSYYNQNTSQSTMSSSDSDSSREILEGLESTASCVINELDEVLNEESATGNAHRNISLSVVEKTSPFLVTPAKGRARPPAIGGMKGSFKSEDATEQPTYDFIPEPDYSPPQSPTSGSPPGIGLIQRDRQTSGVYKQVITRSDSSSEKSGFDSRESGKYNQVIRTEPQSKRSSGEYTKAIKPAPGAVNVMSNFTEIPKLRRVGSKDTTETLNDSERTNARDRNSRNSLNVDQEKDTNNTFSVKQKQENIENTYMNETKERYDEKSDKMPSPRDKIPSPRDKTRFPPPPPTGPKRAPPPPLSNIPPAPPPCSAPAPPAVPPPLSFTKQVKGRLKQVHWSRTPKPLVQNSIWERPHDMTPKLNLRLLEEQFSLKERDTPPTPGPKSPGSGGKQLLVDAKRAQILDIFMSGLKNEGTRKLIDVLNSVTEDDSFPAEKLNTIRRYQPSEDEIDMYKAYAHKKHELHPVDQFMLELCEIPCLSIRIDICLTLWEFPWQYESTCQLVDQVHAACDELLNSQMFVLVLEYLLAIGNHLNRNWSESHVTSGFQITSLDKILSLRGKDTGYTLVHFLVEQLRMSDPGLVRWTETVQMVKKCEQISVKSVAAESEVLKGDLAKVKRHLKTLKAQAIYCSRQDNKFQQDAQNLTVEYEMKLEKLDRRGGELHNKYRKILTRFGEPLYQKSDQLFAVVANFADKFKAAMKDMDTKAIDRKTSA